MIKKLFLTLILFMFLFPLYSLSAVAPIVKPYAFSNGTVADATEVNQNFDIVYGAVNDNIIELNSLEGSTSSPTTRMNVQHNQDGTHKDVTISGGNEYISTATATYNTTSKFFLDDDQTDVFLEDRRVEAILSGSTVYSDVSTAVYNSTNDNTLITISDAVLTDPISEVNISIIRPLSDDGSVNPAMIGATLLRQVGKIPFWDSIVDSSVYNIADLRDVDITSSVDNMIVLGYYTRGDGGGGSLRYKVTGAAPGTYTDDGGSIIVPSGGDGSAAWLLSYPLENVKEWGAVGDDVTDDLLSIQAALDYTGNDSLLFPNGDYYVSDTLNPPDGKFIYGTSKKDVVIRTDAGKTLIKWQPAGAGGRYGFFLTDVTLMADYCIQINDTATFLANGSGDSPFIQGYFQRIDFKNVTTNTGDAFTASKMFDTKITDCNFIGTFDRDIVLNGCDINEISNNRLQSFQSVGILDVSGQTFGSQNNIFGNDMVLGTNTDASFIRTSSRHVQIHDNYFEQQGASGSGIIVDVSLTDTPTFGSNVQDNAFTIDIRNNRIDGQHLVQYVHRIDPSEARTIIVTDKNPATFNLGTSVFETTNNDVQMNFDGYNNTYMEISGSSWGDEWDGYKSSGNVERTLGGFTVNAQNTAAFLPYNFTTTARIKGKSLIMPTTLIGGQLVKIMPNEDENRYFYNSATITVSIIARTDSSSGDTLSSLFTSSSGSSGSTGLALDEQFQELTYTFTGPAFSDTTSAIALNRSTNNGNIEIISISWTY
jgi:hypothetical protein